MNLQQLDLLIEYVRTVHFIMVIGQLIFFLAKLNLIYLDLAVFTKLLPNHVQIKPRRFYAFNSIRQSYFYYQVQPFLRISKFILLYQLLIMKLSPLTISIKVLFFGCSTTFVANVQKFRLTLRLMGFNITLEMQIKEFALNWIFTLNGKLSFFDFDLKLALKFLILYCVAVIE